MYDENCISDLHKDAFGFRPSGDYHHWWNAASEQERQAEWDSLIQTSAQRVEEEAAAEKVAIVEFETFVGKVIKMGAADRTAALLWIMDGSSANGDWEYLCFLNGLPYGYFG